MEERNDMDYEKKTLSSFCVLGHETSSVDGNGFVKKAWQLSNDDFSVVASLAKKESDGTIKGYWGLMSDFSRSFKPWGNNFKEGLYLAGVEVDPDSVAPPGWTKWIAPARTYLVIKVNPENYESSFKQMVYFRLAYEGYKLVGAAFDYTDNKTQQNYLYFPVEETRFQLNNKDRAMKISPCGLHCGFCFFQECGGCLSDQNYCSFAMGQPDKKCPNVKCSISKGLKGCYECPELETCHYGFFAEEGETAHASAMFIKKHGKKVFAEMTKNMIKAKRTYWLEISSVKGDDERLSLMEKFI